MKQYTEQPLDTILNEIKNAPQFLTGYQYPTVHVDLQIGRAGVAVDLTPDDGLAEIELRYGRARMSLSHVNEGQDIDARNEHNVAAALQKRTKQTFRGHSYPAAMKPRKQPNDSGRGRLR